jgi:hypothetical protein
MRQLGLGSGVALLAFLLMGPASADEPQGVDAQCAAARDAARTTRKYRLVQDDYLAFLCEIRNLPADQANDKAAEYTPRFSVREKVATVSVEELSGWLKKDPGSDDLKTVLARVPAGASEVEVIVPGGSAKSSMRPLNSKAESGKLFRLKPCPTCLDGHYGMTQQTLQELIKTDEASKKLFPVSAHELIADAAQDGDFYAWSDPQAHAQTGSEESSSCQTDACPANEPDCWKQRMYLWVEQQLTRAREACEQSRTREALYFVGYSLHAVQDVATHQGRTNCEHAYDAYIQNSNPDLVDVYTQLGRELSRDYLQAVATKMVAHCGATPEKLPEPQKPQTPSWKKQTLKSSFSPIATLSYRFLVAPRYEKLLQEGGTGRVRWFETGVDESHPKDKAQAVPSCEAIADCKAILDRLLEIPGKVFDKPAH